jgi:hypothetical protein
MQNAIDHFKLVVPSCMDKLIGDFPQCTDEDAAAVFGNAGTESLGLTVLQEIHPTVKGSRGGLGWFQWTGPRRRAYEAYCKRNKLDTLSPDANYAYLFVDLTGAYKSAIARTVAAQGLNAKVLAFEKVYESAGVPNINSRIHWAQLALDAYRLQR